jgi:hypothetical protein
MNKKKNLTISQVKSFLLKKGLTIIKKKNFFLLNKELKSLYFVCLSCVFIIIFFFSMPIIVDLKKKIL